MNPGAVHGNFQKSVSIQTNDPVRPNLVLFLVGEVKTAVAVNPTAVFFGQVVEDMGPFEQRVHLTVPEGTVKLTAPANTPERPFQTILTEKVPGKEYELLVRLNPTPGGNPGRSEMISLTTDHPHQPTLTIQANATVMPRLAVEPAVLQLFDAPEGQPFRTALRFVNRGGEPVQILEVISPDSRFTATAGPMGEDRSATISVEAPRDANAPQGGALFRIRTSDPKKPELTFTLLPKPIPPPSPHQLIGQAAPVFSVKTTAGKEISNASAQKKGVTLLNFFAGDCGYCKKQIPRLEKAVKELDSRKIHLVEVAQKMGREYTQAELEELLNALGLDPKRTPLAIDMANTMGGAFRVRSFPTLVFLDKEGKVAGVLQGNTGNLEADVKAATTALLEGKPMPKSSEVSDMPPPPPRKGLPPRPAQNPLGIRKIQ